MASLLSTGIQYLDAVGEPLAGGFIYFYDADTLDLRPIYTTEEATVQLANPLELTSEGRLPSAGVWLSGSYRIRVTDSALVVINDINDYHAYDLVDFSTLTATIADLNAAAGSVGSEGVVIASKSVVVDSNKDIASFGILTGATLRATTAVRTPQINDANNVAAITVPAVVSQVNSITVTPAVTMASPSITATGSDTNINLLLTGKGTGAVKVSGVSYPVADGTSGQVLTTNGSGVATFASVPVSSQIFKQQVRTNSTSYTALSSSIPMDTTIPQITEGTEVLTASITPTSASSTLDITVVLNVGSASGNSLQYVAALFVDATANAIAATAVSGRDNPDNSYGITPTVISYSVSAATTTARTYRVRVGRSGAQNVYLNGSAAGNLLGGVQVSSITVVEVS